MPSNKKLEVADEGDHEESLDPLHEIVRELGKLAGDNTYSAAGLRKVMERVYPRSSREESMRFLATLTRLRQAAEVAYSLGNEIHAQILNQQW